MATVANPSALGLLLSFPLEDGQAWGDVAEDFQLEDARCILEGDRPYSFIVRSRGSSKTTDMSAVALSLLLTSRPRSRFYWAAADVDQAALALDVIGGLASRSPALASSIELQARRVIVKATESTLEALPADASSAFGLKPAGIFIDELASWPDVPNARRLLDALTTAALKVRDCRLAVLTTAGSPSHFAYQLLEFARSSDLWLALERTGPPPWVDERRLAEQKARLPESVYLQLFEGTWCEVEGSFLAEDVVARAFCLPGPSVRRVDGRSYVASLDLGHVHDRTVFSIGHREGETVVLDVMSTWAGTRKQPVSFSEVEEHIIRSWERYRFELTIDPWQALHVAERLRARGIRTREVSFSPAFKQRLASSLLQSLNDGALHLYPAEGLREELLALRLKVGGGGSWTFDHKPGAHDDRAVSLAMMVVEAVERRPGVVVSKGGGTRWLAEPGRDGGWVAIPVGSGAVVTRGDLRLDEASAARRGFSYVDRPGPPAGAFLEKG